MKRFLAFILCIVLALSMVGCQKKTDTGAAPAPTQAATPTQAGDNKDASKASSTAAPQALTLPLCEPGSVTLTFGTFDNWYTPASYNSNLEIYQAIEKDTGVKIKWDIVPPSQYATTMQTRLAAGTDLPDIINIPDDVVKHASAGIIVPLDELISKYAPDIVKYYAADPLTKKVTTAPDGHIYSLASVVTGTSQSDPYAWIIRKDWIDKVGLKEPTTIDEYYNVLKAFKEKDPNGNGKADELGFVSRYNVMDLSRFGDSWGLHFFYSKGFWPDKDGKVQYEWFDPRTKEMVTWLAKLYKEGLIDPEFMTTKDDERLAKVTRNVVGSATHFINALSNWDNVLTKAGVTDVNHIALAPLAGPNGYKGHTEAYGPTSGNFSISKSCKNPEIAIKWLDYTYASQKGFLYTCFGIEGKSYKMVDGKPQYTEWTTKNPDGLDLSSALRSLGAMPNIPWIRSDVQGYWSWQNAAYIAHLPKTTEMAKKIGPTVIAAYPPIMATQDESQQLSALMTDIDTFRDENIAKFIMGQQSMDNWDKFVSSLKGMGMDQVMKIKQQQYDRFNKK